MIDISKLMNQAKNAQKIKRQVMMSRRAGKFTSKNEKYCLNLLQEKLREYTELEIKGSDTEVLPGWELDVTIKSPYGWNVAIEWDGAYHRKPIYGEKNLMMRQGRDKFKNKSLYEKKYVLIRVRDDGSFNQKFVESKVEKIIDVINDLMESGEVCAYGKIEI